jgi:hypothetical protein
MGTGAHQATYPNQTPNTVKFIPGVSLREISSVVERETTHDRQLRSLNPAKLIRKLDCRDSQDVGLEAATI